MTPRYAANTEVSVERSKGELEKTLARYGAHAFMSGWDQERAVVEFLVNERRVRFVLPLPDRNDPAFTRSPSGRVKRSAEQVAQAWEQACRQSWRALNLVVKAKLEAVEAGISTFDQEFMASLVLANGQTVAERLLPELDALPAAGPLLALGRGA